MKPKHVAGAGLLLFSVAYALAANITIAVSLASFGAGIALLAAD